MAALTLALSAERLPQFKDTFEPEDRSELAILLKEEYRRTIRQFFREKRAALAALIVELNPELSHQLDNMGKEFLSDERIKIHCTWVEARIDEVLDQMHGNKRNLRREIMKPLRETLMARLQSSTQFLTRSELHPDTIADLYAELNSEPLEDWLVQLIS